jgi:phosphoribosylamine---glycine ligase
MLTLVLGTGGREHAIAWKLARDLGPANVFLHPGNAGTESTGLRTLGSVDWKDSAAVASRAKELGISLIVIGPEVLLADGFADRLRELGFLVVGPGRAAAQLESSKVFAKEFMKRAEIPTAPFEIVESAAALEKALTTFPIVLKLDGLAAGKGVVVAMSREEALDFSRRIWSANEFGTGPHKVVLEGFLPGVEVSYLGFCDGKRFVPLATATDYKRVGDGNTGGNTGGMGAISPSPYFTDALQSRVNERILKPLFRQLTREGLDYRGILYVGLMVGPDGEPRVLEFNTRFGDPETQAILMRFDRNFVELLMATARGNLAGAPAPVWSPKTSVYVVAAAEGYPGKVKDGDAIEGAEAVGGDAQVFFSGVARKDSRLTTAGGRVLGVGALGKDGEEARRLAYGALERVRFRGMHYRRDIGKAQLP